MTEVPGGVMESLYLRQREPLIDQGMEIANMMPESPDRDELLRSLSKMWQYAACMIGFKVDEASPL